MARGGFSPWVWLGGAAVLGIGFGMLAGGRRSEELLIPPPTPPKLPGGWQGPMQATPPTMRAAPGALPTVPAAVKDGTTAVRRAFVAKLPPPLGGPNPTASRSLEHLEPGFRAVVTKLLAAMKARGFDPSIAVGWRNEAWQRNAFAQGKSRIIYSLHTVTYPDGTPAGLAADIVQHDVGWPAKTLAENPAAWTKAATFFQALRDEAKKLGLDTGGDYSKSNAEWAKFGLGWDPAHVMVSRAAERNKLVALRARGPAALTA